MTFKLTFEPRNRIKGVMAKTVVKDTAAEAWKIYQALEASDERVTINDGGMGWMELRQLAEREA